MISKNVDIWAGDGHALIDTVTGKVINAGGGQITIGHHVWIGANVILTKNAKVADNSVIGTGGGSNKIVYGKQYCFSRKSCCLH